MAADQTLQKFTRLLTEAGAATQAEHEVNRAVLDDVAILEALLVVERLAAKDEPLFFWRNALFVLDLRLIG